jgi:hypothetical protein
MISYLFFILKRTFGVFQKVRVNQLVLSKLRKGKTIPYYHLPLQAHLILTRDFRNVGL